MEEAPSSGWSEGRGRDRGQVRCVGQGEQRLCALSYFTLSVPRFAHLGNGLRWHLSQGAVVRMT